SLPFPTFLTSSKIRIIATHVFSATYDLLASPHRKAARAAPMLTLLPAPEMRQGRRQKCYKPRQVNNISFHFCQIVSFCLVLSHFSLPGASFFAKTGPSGLRQSPERPGVSFLSVRAMGTSTFRNLIKRYRSCSDPMSNHAPKLLAERRQSTLGWL